MNTQDIPWSWCCTVKSLFNDWIFIHWTRTLKRPLDAADCVMTSISLLNVQLIKKLSRSCGFVKAKCYNFFQRATHLWDPPIPTEKSKRTNPWKICCDTKCITFYVATFSASYQEVQCNFSLFKMQLDVGNDPNCHNNNTSLIFDIFFRV